MASYFDLPPPARSKAAAAPTAELLDIPDNEAFGRNSLLSPQVTKILEDMDLDDKSSDEDNEASLSGDSIPSNEDDKSDRKSRRDKHDQHKGLPKVQTPPLPHLVKKVHIAAPPRRPGVGGGQKHLHLARFHSLRSILFLNHIESNIEKGNGKKEAETENQWKAQHEKRKGFNRPKTPESPPKDGIAHRIGNKLRRMTSKDVPTMNSVKEDADNESTASDDEDHARKGLPEDEEEISHSDIEELVRWVSRRDPPSDGERRKSEAKVKEVGQEDEDSGHESLGHSDVEDLVRWLSRKDMGQPKPFAVETKQQDPVHTGYSDGSTESDSDDEFMDDEDLDDLVRWVSRREGPNAGPRRENNEVGSSGTSPKTSDKPPEKLIQRVTRQHETSGESDIPDKKTLHTVEEQEPSKEVKRKRGSSLRTEVLPSPPARESNSRLTHDDADELVQWVSRKDRKQK